jgi:hypothetical protein
MYNMLTAQGTNAPAPWVPYTRAGCNVGGVATANIELENISTDIPTVFGANSPQAQEVASNPNQATADFVGIAVHCAQGASLCSSANSGLPDALPQEPGGYNGYMALYGNKYVAPQISPNGPMTDLNGNVIQDSNGDIGFPGFDGMTAAVSLSYVAAMQEHGIPVTYAYISDAHDNHTTGNAYGPGEAGYVAQLKSYDEAFNTFFTRLANDGINQSNTLFVFTSDEGDHFVGAAPSPRDCDGVTVPCTYSKIGELNSNLTGLLATEQANTTPFSVHSDSAPVFYVNGNPGPTDPTTRALERAVGKLTATNPINGNTDNLTNYMADPTELKLLHMITADPHRTPTFIMFAKPDYYLYTGSPNCSSPCTTQEPGYAWNHGDVSPDINTTWLGMVGPGVRQMGEITHIWTDHTDIRPTIMALLGLKDDYQHDGRVIYEVLQSWAVPQGMQSSDPTLLGQFATAYKQLNAPVGVFGLNTLEASTWALKSNSIGDHAFTSIEGQLASMGTQRDSVASQMIAMLEGAEFNNQPLNSTQAQSLLQQAYSVIGQSSVLASNPD